MVASCIATVIITRAPEATTRSSSDKILGMHRAPKDNKVLGKCKANM